MTYTLVRVAGWIRAVGAGLVEIRNSRCEANLEPPPMAAGDQPARPECDERASWRNDTLCTMNKWVKCERIGGNRCQIVSRTCQH